MSTPDRSAESTIFSVSQITLRIQHLIESEIPPVWVLGEISNFRCMDTGHLYFTLKDESAQIPCVMFRSSAAHLRIKPTNGNSIRVFGAITVFPPHGRYQIQVQAMELAGAGELHLAFERLKAKLAAEGLFDPQKKRPLPRFPQKIGIVTAESGAAIQDIRNIISRRFPLVKLMLYSVRVQGEGASQEIATAIHYFSNLPPSTRPDLMIVGRGGGSIEDLWAFNEEIVARAIANSSIPVVSAVGHEIDFTISDFVADYRAPTPSGAAEIVVPDMVEIRRVVYDSKSRLHRAIRSLLLHRSQQVAFCKSSGLFRPMKEIHNRMLKLDLYCEKLSSGVSSRIQRNRVAIRRMESSLRGAGPIAQLNNWNHRLDMVTSRITNSIQGNMRLSSFNIQILSDRLTRFSLSDYRYRLELLSMRLSGYNPRAILKRGYAICSRDDGNIVQAYTDVREGEKLRVELSEGELTCEVKDRRFI